MFLREKRQARAGAVEAFRRRSGRGEYEIKYEIPWHTVPALSQWLALTFPADREHPWSTICSVYLDTPALDSLEEKAASFYEKTKYRVRWYADASGQPLSEAAFFEIKEKSGAVRRKRRARIPFRIAELSSLPLDDPRWFSCLMQQDLLPPATVASLRPVLELRYQRHRYRHPLTGDSICLDSDIRCVRSHPAFFPATAGRTLGLHIVEQKGPSSDPLPALRSLPRFLARRASLSKYYLVSRQLIDPDPTL